MKYLFSLVLLLYLTGISQGQLSQIADPPTVLARWRDGQLTTARYRSRYDREGTTLTRSDRDRNNGICRAVFREIYGPQALALGLDRTEEFAVHIQAWRRNALAGHYVQKYVPATLTRVTPSTLQRYYRHHLDRYSASAQADIDVLFVRCNLRPTERAACRERIAQLDRRLAAGEAFADLRTQEKERSGNANGFFAATSLSSLNDELAAATRETAAGNLSRWIEQPHGFCRLHVIAKRPAVPLPFAQIEAQVKQDVLLAQHQIWERKEVTRLGAVREANPEGVLAEAAFKKGLDRTPAFVAAEEDQRRWLLADRAFALDTRLWPDDKKLAALREAQGPLLSNLRLLFATVDAIKDRPAALKTAGTLAESLTQATDLISTFRQAPTQLSNVQLEEWPPMTREALSKIRLLDPVLVGLEPGRWQGPIPLPVTRLAELQERPQQRVAREYNSLVFVTVLERIPPTEEELRIEFMRQLRSRISTGWEIFLAELGPRWQLELLPEAAVAEQ